MSENQEPTLETLVSLAKRRGFVFPASDIYGGIAGFYDYGPYGTQMARNIKDAWWDAFVRSVPNIHGVDSAIIQNPKVWEASGHVAGFNDPMVECSNCKHRFREDHLDDKEKCENCGKKGTLSEPKQFNMMFETFVGAVQTEHILEVPSTEKKEERERATKTGVGNRNAQKISGNSAAYLRPETAGGIFTNFDLVRETTRAKLPFGIAQIGKAFRNEISPREFLFRVREFEQMEIEYFVNPENADKEYENMKQICWDWLKTAGLNEDNMEWHQHDEQERAHYAADSWDINYKYPFGSKELWGVANRTDYDLKAHAEASGKDLSYYDEAKGEHVTPYVIEPSLGVGRLFLALLHSAYTEEDVNGETRTVLKLASGISPVDVAVLPLSRKPDLIKLSHKIYGDITSKTDLTVEYDETQSIGKRYRRQDEIGTPKAITVDFDSLEDNAVTVRDRDTMDQKRVKIDELLDNIE